MARYALGLLLVAAGLSTHGNERAIAAERVPVVVMFHPGGYAFGDTGLLTEAAGAARSAGLRPVLVDYELADPAQAFRDAKQAARKAGGAERRVYVYGESAGGGLAARVAQAGLAERAATISPIANLDRWANSVLPDPGMQHQWLGSEATQRFLSPVRYESPVPVSVQLGSAEEPSISVPALRWAEKDRAVRLRVVPGGHIAAGHYEFALDRAMRFLTRH